ncbi:MAG: nucleotidyltransferase domain-containing protein [Pseudomonadota bacterium]|nr:nucleotidyltransferase domain-containing protein [Pseudomonadota bacterium]
MSIATAARATWRPGTRVSLFGSRADDSARGGDIDLLVETDATMAAAEIVARRGAFVARLYGLIGERRIDVVVCGPAVSSVPAALLDSARANAIELVRT